VATGHCRFYPLHPDKTEANASRLI
jgi:hypothetical protein